MKEVIMCFKGFAKCRFKQIVRRVEDRNGECWLECTHCHKMKKKEAFSRNHSRRLGRNSICMDCKNKASRRKYRIHKELRSFSFAA